MSSLNLSNCSSVHSWDVSSFDFVDARSKRSAEEATAVRISVLYASAILAGLDRNCMSSASAITRWIALQSANDAMKHNQTTIENKQEANQQQDTSLSKRHPCIMQSLFSKQMYVWGGACMLQADAHISCSITPQRTHDPTHTHNRTPRPKCSRILTALPGLFSAQSTRHSKLCSQPMNYHEWASEK